MLFLSHANPEDNVVTNWLALRLAAEGYAVWCDLTKLLGGEAFWDDIQSAIEERTVKFLYVLSRSSNMKDGALAELTVAKDVEKKLRLRDFVIPLHIDDLPHNQMHILLRRLNTIPFRESWAAGLNQLVRKLRREKVPRKRNFGPRAVNKWWKTRFSGETGIRAQNEELISNWFEIAGLPETIYVHGLTPGCAQQHLVDSFSYPAVIHGDSLIAFTGPDDFAATLGGGGIWISRVFKLQEFLQEPQSRNDVYRLLRRAWEKMAEGKGLKYHIMSSGNAFCFVKNQLSSDRIAFMRPDGSSGYRALVGYSSVGKTPEGEKRIRYWHYAIRAVPDPEPTPGFWIKSHVLFSDESLNIWESANRLHAARRSQCSDWWNDSWRDRLLAAMNWLADGAPEITIPLGSALTIRVPKFPLTFQSPVSYVDPISVEIVDESGAESPESGDPV